jgi:ABC-2 type transport system ATP-binding protein
LPERARDSKETNVSSTSNGRGVSPAIRVESLVKTFPGGVEAVKGVTFDVMPGEVFGLLGPNGAGKSTTVGMLTTTVTPTAGRAWLAGHDVARDPVAARQMSAVVFQEPVVDRSLTGRHNLIVHGRLWGLTPQHLAERIGAVVDAFDLAPVIDRSVDTYSGGQRRRLEIARALLSLPSALFLDEPTVGLDPRIRSELAEMIAGLRARDAITILLTTHYLEEAEQLCDRVAILHEGTIAAVDQPAALVARLGGAVVEVRAGGEPAATLAALKAHGIAGDNAFVVGNSARVPVEDAAAAVAAIGALGLSIEGVSSRPTTLDDVYLQLTGSSLAA